MALRLSLKHQVGARKGHMVSRVDSKLVIQLLFEHANVVVTKNMFHPKPSFVLLIIASRPFFNIKAQKRVVFAGSEMLQTIRRSVLYPVSETHEVIPYLLALMMRTKKSRTPHIRYSRVMRHSVDTK